MGSASQQGTPNSMMVYHQSPKTKGWLLCVATGIRLYQMRLRSLVHVTTGITSSTRLSSIAQLTQISKTRLQCFSLWKSF
jgi:hypothetical protein